MKHLTLAPAYLRDYKNTGAARLDWESGKDFVVATFGPDDGRCINKEDIKEPVILCIRFDSLRKSCSFVAQGVELVQDLTKLGKQWKR